MKYFKFEILKAVDSTSKPICSYLRVSIAFKNNFLKSTWHNNGGHYDKNSNQK
jgi:hypothetical protein